MTYYALLLTYSNLQLNPLSGHGKPKMMSNSIFGCLIFLILTTNAKVQKGKLMHGHVQVRVHSLVLREGEHSIPGTPLQPFSVYSKQIIVRWNVNCQTDPGTGPRKWVIQLCNKFRLPTHVGPSPLVFGYYLG